MAKLKESTHQRLAPAPKQSRIPGTRRTLRSGQTRPSLLALKKQSTLTQLEFGDLPSSSRRTVSDSEKDECEEEDIAESRPKKKRKLKDTPRAPDQSSLTQKWSDVEMSKMRYGSDKKGNRWSNPVVIKDFNGGDTRDTQAIAMDLRQVIEETPLSSQRIPDSEPSSSAQSLHEEYTVHPSSPGHETTRPTTANSAMTFKTPQKILKTVIPSSNTPSSVQLSVHRSGAWMEFARSPLKERSCNRRVLDKSQSYVTARESPSPLKRPLKVSSARRFARTNTIHDSESDDSDIEEDTEDVTLVLPPAPDLNPESRTLKRTITVQDSDDDLDMEDLDDDLGEDNDNNDDVDDDSTVVEDDLDQQNTYSASNYPQTFDPVSAAMERDAARFGNGPTQLETQYVSFYDHPKDDDEAPVVGGEEEIEFVGESPIAEVIVEASQEIEDVAETSRYEDHALSGDLDKPIQIQDSNEDDRHANELPSIPGSPILETADLNEHHDQHDDKQDNPVHQRTNPDAAIEANDHLPPSPTHPRPSQVSTVMPTQWTTSDRRNSGQQSAPTSPQKSYNWAGNTLSSSPFPMPPWTFSNPDEETGDAGGVRRPETQFDSLVDFSLPPPPPLSSEVRRGDGFDGM
ncbi:unnamed protein product [Zymoseptoria tritici ST99CH_3D1]|uniref:Uncharacterized protein n=2 Tax=Zymoseptoria tritici TaxID=1047171 RepID=A0A1X7RS53_ZYMT9|nr:unnamed protein product [Zymoseptoria tritici ST99CH_3D7]SMR51013.1 unnamed protein product [Zymoseptoria tritici ST99CH_1E4]SMR51952.1 unnamed protein product [Zymoseptoria tritici ST99CH_3D1]